jgi:hypothetical protein
MHLEDETDVAPHRDKVAAGKAVVELTASRICR